MPSPAVVTWGDIEGSSIKAEYAGYSDVYAVDHNISIPLDVHTGKKTGVREYSPFTLTKPIDKASYALFKHLTTGVIIPEVTVVFIVVDDAAGEIPYYSITLEEVKVSGIKTIMPNTKHPANSTMGHLEEVSLGYSKIIWKYLDGNLECSDSWSEKPA